MQAVAVAAFGVLCSDGPTMIMRVRSVPWLVKQYHPHFPPLSSVYTSSARGICCKLSESSLNPASWSSFSTLPHTNRV